MVDVFPVGAPIRGQLRITCRSLPGRTTLVEVIGEIDLATRGQFAAALSGCVGNVVLDLAGVTLLDGGGVGVMQEQRRRLERLGGCLTARNLQPLPRRVLEIAGMHSWFVDGVDERRHIVARSRALRARSSALRADSLELRGDCTDLRDTFARHRVVEVPGSNTRTAG